MPTYFPDVDYYGRVYNLKFYDREGNLLATISQDLDNDYRGLRITFDIKQMAYTINQTARIDIYNVTAPRTKELITKAFSVVLECGYITNTGILYSGNIINAYYKRQQPDYCITLWCLDYASFYKPVQTVIAAGSTIAQAIKQLTALVPSLEVNDKNLYDLPTTPISNSISIPLMEYSAAFNKLGLLTNTIIWIVNFQVYAVPKELQVYPLGSETININYSTGMIGSPYFDVANSGVDVVTLLNHRLTPGNLIQIQTLDPEVQAGGANYINFSQQDITRGKWFIMETQHIGDSMGQEWYTHLRSYAFQSLGQNVL